MATMNEVMNKNKEPKWLTEDNHGNQGEKQGGKKGKGGGGGDNDDNNNSNQQSSNKPKTPSVPKQDYKVKMCCPKCEEKVLEEARYVYGVQSVSIDRGHSKVTVAGNVDPTYLLKKFKKNIDKKACFWPLETKKDSGSGGKSGKGNSKGGEYQGSEANVQKQGKGDKGNNNNNGNHSSNNNNSNNGNNGGSGEKKNKSGGGGNGGNNQQNNGGGHGGGHGGDNAPKNKNKDNNNANNNNQNKNEGGHGHGHGGGQGHESGHGGGEGKGKGKGGGNNGNSNQNNNNQNSNNHNSNNNRDIEYPPPLAFRDQMYDYRSFQPIDPRVVDPRSGYGGGGYYPGYYPSYYSGSQAADRDYQPKANYFSDYRPSQSYAPGFHNMEYTSQPITNPYYMKSIHY